MNNEDNLRTILNDQNLNQNQIENLKNQRDAILGVLIDEIGGNPIKYNGGSYAKGTMIQASYDLDIVLYWPSDYHFSLQDLYTEVGSVLQRNGRRPHSKKVGWEIPFPGDFHIDVIPGKKILNRKGYAYLFNTDNSSRFRTNVKKQVNYVKNSKRQDVIRLMKLWKKRKDVPIKTFILEQIVIEGCKGISRTTLEPQLNAAFKYIEDNINTKRITDLANSQNIISNDITKEEKNRIRRLATQAIDADRWNQVFF